MSIFPVNAAFGLLYGLSLKGYHTFANALSAVESVQREKLRQLIAAAENTEFGARHGLSGGMDYERFADTVPVTTYVDWEPVILEQKETGRPLLTANPCQRYQPTSGSSAKMKWIPFTSGYLGELDAAISPMLVSAFRTFPGLFRGKHYWSLSWVPTELRASITPEANDDMQLLPWWKRIFMGLTMAVPTEVSYAKTSETSMVASLAYLFACRDLAFISIWSPTFALNFLDQAKEYRDELVQILDSRSWGSRSAELSHLPCPGSKEAVRILESWDKVVTPGFLEKVWPRLALVSSWDTSTSSIWASELKRLFPRAGFLAKGLWATEGVVTIPFAGEYPLAVTSHFYEFLDPETGRIHPPWGLETGQVVRPLLSTGSGFFRYDLQDQVQVVGFMKDCPCFSFLGRASGVDMTGEKMTPAIAVEVIQRTMARYDIKPLALIATSGSGWNGGKPGYTLLCEEQADGGLEQEIARFAEKILSESFHYKLAAELGQLGPLKVVFHPEARRIYKERNEKRGMRLGDMKIEPLVLWDPSETAALERMVVEQEA